MYNGRPCLAGRQQQVLGTFQALDTVYGKYISEKARGLDFSMLYVGDLQRNVEHYHGYSMTDAKEMKRILGTVPLEPAKTGFIDLGCGKGMCLKCAAEEGL